MATELMRQSTDGLLKRDQKFDDVIAQADSLIQQPETPVKPYPYATKDLVTAIAQAAKIPTAAAKSRLNNLLTRDPEIKDFKPKKVKIPGKDGPKMNFFTPEQRDSILGKASLVRNKRGRRPPLEEEKKPLYL